MEWEKELNTGDWKPICLGRVNVGTEMPRLALADDIALITYTAQESCRQVEALKECAEKVGKQISFEKTEFFRNKTGKEKIAHQV